MGVFTNLSARTLGAGLRNAAPIMRRIRTVSFAQYAEDLLLHHMHPLGRGFYVDVGAYHPQDKSNTWKLYLKGWHGLTIEPNPDAASAFRAMRPRDRHLVAGVAAERTELTYHRFRNPEENTFAAAWAAGRGPANEVGQVKVECLPLSAIFSTHCRDQPVDLLSVDCEGLDFEVIRSLDWQVHRPTVVIVEDIEQFDAGISATAAACGSIRRFMVGQEYALASQAVFSSFYVDRRAFAQAPRDHGFRLDQTQLGALAL